ncbi:MAG: DUF2188 domain-containing protein [Longimicrobiales bacterium]|nr:DUF2188 domain-containing protein [Longimicrobiales bacterium]
MAAKPISKKIEKQVKKGRKTVEKQAKKVGKKAKAVEKKAKAVTKKAKKQLKADKGPSKAKVAGVAAAGVAGIAGIAAALHYLRRDSKGRAKLHVIAKDSEWHITAEGKDEPIDRFSTKEEAVDAARDAAQQAAPSDLIIHRLDGTVMRSHSYEPEK